MTNPPSSPEPSNSYPANSSSGPQDFSYQPFTSDSSGGFAAANNPSGGMPAQQPSYDSAPNFLPPAYEPLGQPYAPPQAYGAPNGQGAPMGVAGGQPGPGNYGYDPVTGLPFSDKTKATAGLLQLFFGGFGVGRFYIGDTTLGGIQLALFFVGLVLSFFLIGFFVWSALGIWVFIDAIMMFTGSVRDAQGRPLR